MTAPLTYPSTIRWILGLLAYRKVARRLLFSERQIFERNIELATGVAWPSALLFITLPVVATALDRMPEKWT